MQVTDFTGVRRTILPTSADIFRAINANPAYHLSRGRVPCPYAAKAAYRKEPFISDGRRAEIWRPWWEVLRAGWGDCEDWSGWFVAWSRQQGDTTARIALIQFPAGGWHAVAATRRPPLRPSDSVYRASQVTTRYPGATIYLGPGVSPDGWWITDVSYAHGMRDPYAPSVYARGVEAAEREPLEHNYQPGVDPYYSAGLEVSGLSDIPWWVWGAGLAGGAYLLSGPSAIPDSAVRALPWQHIWLPLYGIQWARRLIVICRELGIDPAELLAVMYVETGHTFRTDARNPKSDASGLIQFMPRTAAALGYTTAQIRAMTGLQQLELIRSYFGPAKGKLHSLADVYTWVFLPARLGRDVLTYRGEVDRKGKLLRYYEGNVALDLNQNGSIEAGEPGQKAREALAAEYMRMRGGLPGPRISGPTRPDDPPLLLEWRKSPTAGNTITILGRAAGLTSDTRLLSQIVTMIRTYTAVEAARDVSEDSSYIAYLLRRVYGLQGSAEGDPSVRQTLENMAQAGGDTLAIVQPVVESGLRAGTALMDAGASAAQGVSRMPWFFWGALAAGGALLAYRYADKRI